MRIVLALTVAGLIAAGLSPLLLMPTAHAQRAAEVRDTEGDVRPGQVLVEARTGLGAASSTPRVTIVQTAPGSERAAARDLAARTGVRAAPNFLRRAQVSPSDPYYSQQWHLPRVGAPALWDVQRGSSQTIIAVLDTGVDPSHPDLTSKLLPGLNALGPDNCGNTGATDDHASGHGTHVAGIAAAATDNGVGVAGIAWNARILPIKVLPCDGVGDDSQIIRGIDLAIANGAHIINLSLGGPGSSVLLEAAMQRAVQAGILVVAAAGNQGTTIPYYPAASAFALAVGSTDTNDRLAVFSNRGPHIAVTAPGVSILSTYRTDLTNWDVAPGYQYKNGTSVSTPIVTGAAALIASHYPTHGALRAGAFLAASADRIVTCPVGVNFCPYDAYGRNDYYGNGRMNVQKALGFARITAIPFVARN
ncbi:MAG: hypothetical protein FJ033_11715 [Chloroflexi bacterium]|nr:hypothetical protein [Chloroflexota bacterium]